MKHAKILGSALLASFFSFLFSIPIVKAHCPLCTITAATVAGGAAMFGVKGVVVGLFTGAAAAAMGMWIGRKIRKKYMPLQKIMITGASVALTIIPVIPFVKEMPLPVYVSLFGGYGTLFNRTYIINKFLLGSIIGAALMYGTPALSGVISRLREKQVPFQGMIIIAILLILVAALLQVAL